MQLDNYFARYQSEISRWRSSYSVEDAEKYILMMNLTGLIATQHGTQILTPGQAFDSHYSFSSADQRKIDNIHSSLESKDPRIDVFGIKNYWFCRNGKALIKDEVVDVWNHYIEGVTLADIIKVLCTK